MLSFIAKYTCVHLQYRLFDILKKTYMKINKITYLSKERNIREKNIL